MAWSKAHINDFSVNLAQGKSEITFSLKYTTSFSLGAIKQFYAKKEKSPTLILQAMDFLNHLFASHPTLSLIPVGRKFFTNDDRDIKKFDIIEFRRGLFQAVHFGGSISLTINIDVTTGVFWNSDCVTALDLASRDLNVPPGQLTSQRLSQQQHHRLSRLLKGLKFRVKHRGPGYDKRQHTISKVARVSAREHTFQMNKENNRTVSVEEYLKSIYSQTLQFPNAVLAVKGDSTYLPLELCYIVPVSSLRPI
jgi:hypothetical protein